jgi:hypothetical protein
MTATGGNTDQNAKHLNNQKNPHQQQHLEAKH